MFLELFIHALRLSVLKILTVQKINQDDARNDIQSVLLGILSEYPLQKKHLASLAHNICTNLLAHLYLCAFP